MYFGEICQLFPGVFFFWQGPTGKKSGAFFLNSFFFLFTPTHITTRQTGGEGWWVLSSPCLSAITTHNLTLAGLPLFFLNLYLNLHFAYLLYMYFAPEMVELLGCNSPISGAKG